MSELTFELAESTSQRLDLSPLIPERLQGMSNSEICKIDVSASGSRIEVGDVMRISGSLTSESDSGEQRILFQGDLANSDFIGKGMTGGYVRIEGSVGHFAGAELTGGKLHIAGNAGNFLGSCMHDGEILVEGHASNHVGAPPPGCRDGQSGGTLLIQKSAGDFCGERMRRGLLAVVGSIGDFAGTRMLGGTILTMRGMAAQPGFLMRRGTLITPQVASLSPTFVDCGIHELGILQIMSRHYAKRSAGKLPEIPTGPVHRYAGCFASLGHGEILVPLIC